MSASCASPQRDAFKRRRKDAWWRSRKSVNSTIDASDAQPGAFPHFAHGWHSSERESSAYSRRRRASRQIVEFVTSALEAVSGTQTDDGLFFDEEHHLFVVQPRFRFVHGLGLSSSIAAAEKGR